MTEWDGTVKVSWRLGVLAAIIGTIVGGAFWAGRFTNRVDVISSSHMILAKASQDMGLQVDRLREQQAADEVGDLAVERRLKQIENVLVRIEILIRNRYRQNNEGYTP